jgi:cellulose synthase/poly-beta-1,6-N-acetylglucosamine synthase-like glycosyltransferase
MRLVMEGWRVVYEPDAVACETASPSLRGEWERRTRMAAGGFQAVGRLRGIFAPRHALAAFQFLSHKVLRWVSPFLMLLAWVGAAGVYAWPLYRTIFWLETGFYLAALAGWGTVQLEWRCRPLRMIFYFCFASATALAGFVRHFTGRQPVTWEKAR